MDLTVGDALQSSVWLGPQSFKSSRGRYDLSFRCTRGTNGYMLQCECEACTLFSDNARLQKSIYHATVSSVVVVLGRNANYFFPYESRQALGMGS